MTATQTMTVGELVAKRPGLARTFEKLGIDYCCGGKVPLETACRKKGLDAATVALMLDAGDSGPGAANSAVDAAAMSLNELADHIVATHHAYLKTELPRLSPLVAKIAARHSDKNPKLTELPVVFEALRAEMESHMGKEEQILFPLIRKIDSGTTAGSIGCCGVTNPIRVMESEHQQAGDALALIRSITDEYSTPPEACNTYRAVMYSLKELEADMHQHVHKENNILFPRAIEREGAAAAH